MSARGKYMPLSLPRRMVCDFLHACRSIPMAHCERQFDLRALREAVAACRPRPNWQTIFFKAFALVAAKRPALRRLYMKYPWPRLYEHPYSIGSMVIARQVDGQEALLYLPIHHPETLSIHELESRISQARQLPLDQVPAFRRQLRWSRFPYPIRQALYALVMNWCGRLRAIHLGTFGMSALASMRVSTIATLVPWTSMVHYTPFAKDGSVYVRVLGDHRVADGVEAALAFQELDRVLHGPILEEVHLMVRAAAA